MKKLSANAFSCEPYKKSITIHTDNGNVALNADDLQRMLILFPSAIGNDKKVGSLLLTTAFTMLCRANSRCLAKHLRAMLSTLDKR